MAYNFKYLSDVDSIESLSDEVNIIIEEHGDIKKIQKKFLGSNEISKELIIKEVEKYLIENPPDGSVTVDSELSETSENPVQNKVLKAELEKKLSKSGHTPNMFLGTTAHGDIVTRQAPKLYMSPATGGTKITLETFEGISEVTVKHVAVDSILSEESENPVQNKVLTREIEAISLRSTEAINKAIESSNKVTELSGQINDLQENGTNSGIISDVDQIHSLINADMLPAVENKDGKILTNGKSKILLRY